ncbi:MAG: hypothetical protein Q9227_000963 [Pyrenula ochraceoflavens]
MDIDRCNPYANRPCRRKTVKDVRTVEFALCPQCADAFEGNWQQARRRYEEQHELVIIPSVRKKPLSQFVKDKERELEHEEFQLWLEETNERLEHLLDVGRRARGEARGQKAWNKGNLRSTMRLANLNKQPMWREPDRAHQRQEEEEELGSPTMGYETEKELERKEEKRNMQALLKRERQQRDRDEDQRRRTRNRQRRYQQPQQGEDVQRTTEETSGDNGPQVSFEEQTSADSTQPATQERGRPEAPRPRKRATVHKQNSARAVPKPGKSSSVPVWEQPDDPFTSQTHSRALRGGNSSELERSSSAYWSSPYFSSDSATISAPPRSQTLSNLQTSKPIFRRDVWTIPSETPKPANIPTAPQHSRPTLSNILQSITSQAQAPVPSARPRADQAQRRTPVRAEQRSYLAVSPSPPPPPPPPPPSQQQQQRRIPVWAERATTAVLKKHRRQ